MAIEGEKDSDTREVIIQLEHDRTVNYAMQQNDIPVVKSLRILNETDRPLQDLRVVISTEPAFATTWEGRAASINPGESFNFGVIDLTLLHDFLASLTERLAGAIHVEVWQEETSLARQTTKIDILAYDEWNGLQSIPEILSAYVTPNHPAIESLLSDAAGVLCQWTGDSAISGYQSRDPHLAALIVGAIYAAIQGKNIRYINPPASFEEIGQKVRLPDRILETRLGTCLDLAVIAASCIEQAGLHPLIIFIEGHAFAGAWLEDETFADVATDDLLRLRKRVELGQITVFETTLLTSDHTVPFEHAIKAGLKHLENESAFRCVIDIRRARKSRIRPLPLRVQAASGSAAPAQSEQVQRDMPHLLIPAVPITIGNADAPPQETPATRLEKWKRKLLDLTLHNRLLSFRESKKNLPILCPDLGSLEDALADGKTFKIFPRLDDLGERNSRNAEVHQRRTGQQSLNEMLREEFHSRRLRADVTEAEVGRRLLEIYREAKLSIEENGANTLYLALGFLSWYETKSSPQRRLAPIILVPLEIERKSLQEGFSIRQGDDEPMVNVTLLAHLQADFDLKISGLDPLPRDDHGIDVPLILRKFREAIVDIDRWEVLESAYIGHFSFAKFLMWRDLEVRAEDLQRSDIVRHLIHTPTDDYPDDGVFPDPDRLDETHGPEITFCPLSADSSQLAAVHAAAAGKSFVLHGPPGTGKSQTITNIIAHSLAVGKTVLFVSEKRAALEVVHRRLSEADLGPFCLELHSNKSNKKHVLEQLEGSLNVQVGHTAEDWLHEAQRLAALRKELNGFVSALHAIRPSGESVFHGISQLIAHRDVPLVKLAWPSIEKIDRQRLARFRDLARRLQLAGKETGHPAMNPWASVAAENWTPELRNNVESMLGDILKGAEALERTASSVSEVVGMEGGKWSRDDLISLAHIAEGFLNCPSLPPKLVIAENWEETKALISEVAKHGRQRDGLREELYARYSEKILGSDLDGLSHQWATAEKSWFLPRWLGQRKVKKALGECVQPSHVPQIAEIPGDLRLAVSLREEEQQVKRMETSAGEMLAHLWRDGEADWDAVESLLERVEAIRKLASRVAGIDVELAVKLRSKWATLVSEGKEQLASDGPIGQRLQAYAEALRLFGEVEAALAAMLTFVPEQAWCDSARPDFVLSVKERTGAWADNLNGLRAWCYWRSVRREAIDEGLQPLVNAYETQGLSADRLQEALARGYYQWWCDTLIGSEPTLSGFFSADFEDKIRQFREIDARYTQLTRREIQARVAVRLPKGQVENKNSEVGLLRHQLQRQRGQLPVRALFQKIPHLLPRLKPCLLMSPISVAQYLDPKHPPFDLVVFDEASQIPIWDAVGALARAKEAVIVGDPKQLPPTNFFSRVDGGDGDPDDSLVEDLESILDDCIAAQLPQRHLNWHYRSRHESLITFSNYHYYGNRLFTFPSPHQELGVSLRRVAGTYDKGKTRTNKAEAEAVVAEILQRLQDPQRQQHSIGVVTFSLAQQLLIDDLLEEARRQHPEIEPYFSDGALEPVFVKNLENVQGDERDVILFSVCYGPDTAGKISMNFGPLNRDGGERRLNVAITRARQEVIVFSTLRADDIDLSRTRARGVADMKCFLDYAERGPAAIAERRATDPSGECESIFEEQVCDALREKGHTIHPQVGCSGYRIDLGVVDPENPGRYLLGIECDGANYHRSKTARDRDKLREEILRGLGWKLHRVWSTDWWEKPAEELARIEAAIEAASQAQAKPDITEEEPERLVASLPSMGVIIPAPQPVTSPPPSAPIPVHSPDLPKYEPFTFQGLKGSREDFYEVRNDSAIVALIEEVVVKEAPVCHELVARRVSEHWGAEKITGRVLRRVEALMARAGVKADRQGEKVFLWASHQDPIAFTGFRIPGDGDIARRNAEELPPREIANAVRYVLEQHISLPEADLIRETARVFGFQRTGSMVEKSIQNGIETLAKEGAIREDDGIFIFP